MSEENVEVVREAWETFVRDGMHRVLADEGFAERYWTEDIVFEDPPEMPDRQTYHGREGVAESLRHFAGAFGQLEIDPVEYLDAGDSVVVICEVRGEGKGSGAPIKDQVAYVHEMRGRKSARIRIFASREQGLAAAGLD
jgi:ketosteroid isomerase-like protein